MDALAKIASRGILGIKTTETVLLFHLLLESYVADLRETEDVSSVKWGRLTAKPCHLRLIDPGSLYFFQSLKDGLQKKPSSPSLKLMAEAT